MFFISKKKFDSDKEFYYCLRDFFVKENYSLQKILEIETGRLLNSGIGLEQAEKSAKENISKKMFSGKEVKFE